MQNLNRLELKDTLGYWVSITSNTLKNTLYQKFKSEGLDITHDMWVVLNKLWTKDGQNQQEIANSCDKDKSTVCRIIDNMIKRDLAIRIEDQQDRRHKLIFLTKVGKELQKVLVPLAFEALEQAQKEISEQDLEFTKNILRKILHNLER